MRNITNFDFTKLGKFRKIYVLVSGGIDSTYLLEKITKIYPDKSYAVNCFNPMEGNKILKEIERQTEKYVSIKPNVDYNLSDVIKNAFKSIPEAIKLKKKGKYHKKVFGCCRILKHDMFKKDPRFSEPGTVVVTGIKHGDGSQRAAFLSMLRNGKLIIGTSNTVNNYRANGWDFTPKPTFFHKHTWGATYCYPFRDYYYRELPEDIIEELKEKYNNIGHNGCYVCPVLVVFKIKSEGERYRKSLEYYRKVCNIKKQEYDACEI